MITKWVFTRHIAIYIYAHCPRQKFHSKSIWFNDLYMKAQRTVLFSSAISVTNSSCKIYLSNQVTCTERGLSVWACAINVFPTELSLHLEYGTGRTPPTVVDWIGQSVDDLLVHGVLDTWTRNNGSRLIFCFRICFVLFHTLILIMLITSKRWKHYGMCLHLYAFWWFFFSNQPNTHHQMFEKVDWYIPLPYASHCW